MSTHSNSTRPLVCAAAALLLIATSAQRAGAFPKWRIWLRLGRVSNLPTVWTNALAGMILAKPEVDARAGAST